MVSDGLQWPLEVSIDLEWPVDFLLPFLLLLRLQPPTLQILDLFFLSLFLDYDFNLLLQKIKYKCTNYLVSILFNLLFAV